MQVQMHFAARYLALAGQAGGVHPVHVDVKLMFEDVKPLLL